VVENTGKMKGDEVVQLYVKASKDEKSIKTLKGFKRISLESGEKTKVTFEVTPEVLTRWIDEKGFTVEDDTYSLMVGSSSEEKSLKKIELIVKP
jgi:beta-glucosidase